MAFRYLLSTDFDGTLIGHPSDGKCVPVLAEQFQRWMNAGAAWVINTGRTLDHIIEGVELFSCPVQPNYLITCEREIYFRSQGAWVPHAAWNDRCQEVHFALWTGAAAFFREVELLVERTQDVNCIYEEGILAGLITTEDAVMDATLHVIDEMRAELPDLGYQRNTIYLRFCHRDFSKGSALRELCRMENISPSRVFAAGDQYNDLSMFDPAVAGMLACPANSVEAVRKRIRETGGIIAGKKFGEGTAEALAEFFEQRKIPAVHPLGMHGQEEVNV